MSLRFPNAVLRPPVILPDEGDLLDPLIGEPKIESVVHRTARLNRAHKAQPWLGKHCRSCEKSQLCKVQDSIFFGNYKELPRKCEERVKEK